MELGELMQMEQGLQVLVLVQLIVEVITSIFEASTGGSDTAVLVSPAVDISAGVDAA